MSSGSTIRGVDVYHFLVGWRPSPSSPPLPPAQQNVLDGGCSVFLALSKSERIKAALSSTTHIEREQKIKLGYFKLLKIKGLIPCSVIYLVHSDRYRLRPVQTLVTYFWPTAEKAVCMRPGANVGNDLWYPRFRWYNKPTLPLGPHSCLFPCGHCYLSFSTSFLLYFSS